MGSYRVISSDSHIVEPPDLWTTRMDASFRDRAPHVVAVGDDDVWMVEGYQAGSFGGGTQAGVRFEEPERLTYQGKVEQVRPGGYIPDEHVKDMDLDSVDVGLVYPTIGLQMYKVLDSRLLTPIFRAYNDWVADFCAAYPHRLKGIAMLNTDDIGEAVVEMEQCARMGMVGALITVFPPPERSYDLPEYEPLWAAAQDLGMPLSLHTGTNRPGPGQELSQVEDARPAFLSTLDHWVRVSLGHIIFSGVFERYPKLQVGVVEHELSWVPHALERMDFTYTQRPRGETWHRFRSDMLPSDYFRRNMFLGFQEDGLGIKLREIIGVDNLLWGSDYPHIESTFPRSREILEEILTECTEEEKAKIAGGNTARVYRLD